MNVRHIYEGSDGEATRALYARLEKLGPAGVIALNLFRASKCSARAKVYRGGNGRGSFRGMAYDRKNWSLKNLCEALERHGDELGIRWGWKEDPAQAFHRWVLYVELPTGQVSYHADGPMGGRRFVGEWDGFRDSAGRVLLYASSLLVPLESEVLA